MKWKLLIGTLVLIAVLIWLIVLSIPEKKLSLIACDVGQGDAILATYGMTQVLYDGGPNNRVLDCLARYMPFWDRTIEVVVMSHPQRDHFYGLIEVFKRYNVGEFVTSGLGSSSQEYQVLAGLVGSSNAKVVNNADRVELGNGAIYLDIVHPTNAFISSVQVKKSTDNSVLGAFTSGNDPNDFSVVVHLKYKEFDALLTGDAGPEVIDDILATGEIKDVEYMKVPHHGSKNGLNLDLLQAATPEIAVISVGKNQWGHPHQEVLDMLRVAGVQILRTDEVGDVIIVSDGDTYRVH
jgi:competence protein ComEC